MIDGAVETSYMRLLKDPILERVRVAIDKTTFVYELRQLSGRRPVDALIALAREYNEKRADPSYLVDTFIINGPNGGFSEVNVKTGEVKPKGPYPILPMV